MELECVLMVGVELEWIVKGGCHAVYDLPQAAAYMRGHQKGQPHGGDDAAKGKDGFGLMVIVLHSASRIKPCVFSFWHRLLCQSARLPGRWGGLLVSVDCEGCSGHL